MWGLIRTVIGIIVKYNNVSLGIKATSTATSRFSLVLKKETCDAEDAQLELEQGPGNSTQYVKLSRSIPLLQEGKEEYSHTWVSSLNCSVYTLLEIHCLLWRLVSEHFL